MSLLRRRGLWLALLLVMVGCSAPGWMGAYYLGVFTTAYYFSVFAMSWDLLFGFAGEVNFGPTFMIGVGAYAAGLMNNAGYSIPLCLIGGAAAAVVGGIGTLLVVGLWMMMFPTLRRRQRLHGSSI